MKAKMKKQLRLLSLMVLLGSAQLFAQNFTISGTLTDSVSGQPLANQPLDFNRLLPDGTYGWAGNVQTDANGYFEKINCTDTTTYQFEYAPYGSLDKINGNYYFPQVFNEVVTINGADVTNVELKIKPQPAIYQVSGGIYDENTQELITGYSFSVYSKRQWVWLNIYDHSSDDGTFITEGMPHGIYDITVYGNEFYYDKEMTIEIAEGGPELIEGFDFYLEPKLGTAVSGYLRNLETNEPITNRDMRCAVGPNDRYYTTTDENGQYVFPNVLPGLARINPYPEDTAYWYGEEGYYSKEVSVTVPEEGVDNVDVFMERWEQKSLVTSDLTEFTPGQEITLELMIDNNYDTPHACFALQMMLPEGISLVSQSAVTQNGSTAFSVDGNYPGTEIAWSGFYWRTAYGEIPHWQGNLGLSPATASITLSVDADFNGDLNIGYRMYYDRPSEYRSFFDYGELLLENTNMMYTTVSGMLQTSDTKEPMPAKKMSLMNDEYFYSATTDAEGYYMFDNVMEGMAYKMMADEEDIHYWNGDEGFMEVGELMGGQPYSFTYYMQPYEVKNEISSNQIEYSGDEMLEFSLQLENNYKAIWGIQLDIPQGVSIVGLASFLSESRSIEVLPYDENLSTDKMLVWEGIGIDGIGMFPSNTLAMANLSAEFSDNLEGDVVFNYRIYYDEPGNFDQALYDFGTITMKSSGALGIFDNKNEKLLSVYPNPSRGNISFSLELDSFEEVKVEVYDTRGMMVYQASQTQTTSGVNTVNLDLATLPKGLYLLQALTQTKRYTAKILLD
jgi:uncharacterized repeat protein (TIGR01451 family)